MILILQTTLWSLRSSLQRENPRLWGLITPIFHRFPVLNSMVELPALPEVETFTSLDLERFINQLPYLEELRKLESAGRDLLNRLLRP